MFGELATSPLPRECKWKCAYGIDIKLGIPSLRVTWESPLFLRTAIETTP